MVAQLAIGVLGVLAVTSEYSTGMIRSTFAAAPQRGTLIAAKAAVFGAVAFAVGPSPASSRSLSARPSSAPEGSAWAPPARCGRLSASARTSACWESSPSASAPSYAAAPAPSPSSSGCFWSSPLLAPLLPTSIRDTVGKFLPYIAGQAIFNTTNNTTTLSPWAGLAVFALYAAAALAIAIILIRHRDA